MENCLYNFKMYDLPFCFKYIGTVIFTIIANYVGQVQICAMSLQYTIIESFRY